MQVGVPECVHPNQRIGIGALQDPQRAVFAVFGGEADD